MVDEKLLKLSLSDLEVKERVEQGLVNINADAKSKSVKRIVFDNVVTFFNMLNLLFAVLLVLVGSYRDMLFMGVVVTNTIIGIVQEIRSKKAVDVSPIATFPLATIPIKAEHKLSEFLLPVIK